MSVIAPGERLLGRFRALRPLADRADTPSYLAIDEEAGGEAVLRVLRLRGASSWKAVELLEREARVLAALRHPAIPRLLAHGHEEREGEVLFLLAKEYVPGETLAERVSRGPLDERAAAALGARTAEVLAFLHGLVPPIVHRDLKPTNLVLRESGDVTLIDFGAVADPARLAGGSTIVGTYGYIAPEQVVGDAGPAADLYALGATLLFAMTARDPATLPREGLKLSIAGAVPPGPLARVIAQLLEPDPRQRPASAELVRARLAAIAAQRAVGVAPAEAPDEASARWRSVLEGWDDEAAHDDFIAWCAGRRLLPFAGQCYREVLDERPEDPKAARGKGRVLAQAQALLAADIGPRRDWQHVRTAVRAATWFLLFAAIIVLVYFAMGR